MKILLVNDNPVVNKLVTLSAQKTSDELEVVNSLDEISQNSYDLLVIDDTLYSDELYSELNAKIKYTKSLFICSRDTEEQVDFTQTLKKPFLPTDLVEIFSMLGRKVAEIDLEEEIDLGEDLNLSEESEDEFDFEELGNLEGIDELGDLEDLDTLSDDEELTSLEDLEELEELEDFEEQSELGEPVLDTEEAQKVKDLLEETEVEIDDSIEDAIILDEEDLPNKSEDLTLDLEPDENDIELEEEVVVPEELDELSLEEEEILEESSDEVLELNSQELDLESQIESAVEELSQEELDSEVDEETLLDIVASDIDSLDGLTTRDLKIAVGEEVEDEVSAPILEEVEEIAQTNEPEENSNGVEALKNLLAALSDKNVAASMKGMKISINITLGDNA